jgi:hypothetical protein
VVAAAVLVDRRTKGAKGVLVFQAFACSFMDEEK